MLPGLTESEFNELFLSVGKTMRSVRPLTPVEVGSYCEKALAAGATKKAITYGLGMTDVSMISKFVSLTNLSPEIRHLIDWGKAGKDIIGFSAAAQLARIDASTHGFMANSILKNRLTKEEMLSVIQLYERSGQSLEACVERVVGRRPIVVTRQVVMGAIVSEDLQEKLSSMSQRRRDEVFNSIIKRLYPDMVYSSARLGDKRFTVVGKGSVEQAIVRDGNFETRINDRLMKKLRDF
jgi:hypothetical protein